MSYELFTRDESGQYLPASAMRILEIARIVADDIVTRDMKFNTPACTGQFLVAKLGSLTHEVFAVLFLDNQHQLIEYREMFRGTLDSCSVHPREVVKEALLLNAGALVLSHNHPSGQTSPSNADRAITKRLQEALALIDIRILDHLVIGGGRYASFAELGLL